MERPTIIREEYLECLDAFKLREGLAAVSESGYSQLIHEFGLEPEIAKMVSSYWMSNCNTHECALSGTCR